jgi:hypothetical protein
MPPPPDATLFQCKFCGRAKQQHESNLGSPMSSENFKAGTACHVDLGLICGPNNLTNKATDGATTGECVIEGRRGKEGCLLIANAASREAWTFLLKNKNPPKSLINSFLQKNGAAGSRKKITTHPDGMLARSNWFQPTCESKNGFEPDTHKTEIDFECIRGDAPLTLRHDQGGELTADQIPCHSQQTGVHHRDNKPR